MRDIQELNKTSFIILSAELRDLTGSENLKRGLELGSSLDLLTRGKYRSCLGSYKGIEELSFIVPYKDELEYRSLVSLARHFNQECVLVVNDKREAFLDYLNGGLCERIGSFKEASKIVAKRNESYTIFDERFFICS